MKILEMNRKDVGFISKPNGYDSFVAGINGEDVKVFDNLELLKLDMSNNMGMNWRDYSVYIKAEDEIVPLDDVQKISQNSYEFFVDGTRYKVIENMTSRIIYIGYFVFENGDFERIYDSEIGNKKQKDFMNLIKSVALEYMVYNNGVLNSVKLDYSDLGNYCITFKDSTLKLHLCFNNKVMKINQDRKEAGLKCIPFDKCMDKFSTIYVYATKNTHEPISYGSLGLAKNTIDIITENLVNERPELKPRFTSIDIRGNIYI